MVEDKHLTTISKGYRRIIILPPLEGTEPQGTWANLHIPKKKLIDKLV